MARHEIVTFQNEQDGWARIEVCRANGIIGMDRSRMQFEAAQAMQSDTPTAVRLLRSISYPDLIAPVVKIEGKIQVEQGDEVVMLDLSEGLAFEQFALLPDDLILAWESAVYRVNPHWNPASEPQDFTEKKAES